MLPALNPEVRILILSPLFFTPPSPTVICWSQDPFEGSSIIWPPGKREDNAGIVILFFSLCYFLKAKAVAHESKSTFFSMSASSLTSKYVRMYTHTCMH